MWGLSNGVGLVGLGLNLFLACTWLIAGRGKYFAKQPYQLKFCVFAGLLFGVVATLPSLALKYDLPCECATEEWYVFLCCTVESWLRILQSCFYTNFDSTGSSTMCAINRASMYILLSILVNLCALTYQLVALIASGEQQNRRKSALKVVSTAVPILLGMLGYALEVDIGEGENAQLNTVNENAQFNK
jgi:hypothetical protein